MDLNMNSSLKIILIYLLINLTACSSNNFIKPYGIKGLDIKSATYAEFSLKTGKIIGVYSEAVPIDSSSLLFDLSNDDIVSGANNANKEIESCFIRLSFWDKYGNHKNIKNGDPYACDRLASYKTVKKETQIMPFFGWIMIFPAISGSVFHDLSIDKSKVYELYKEEKKNLDIALINKNIAALKSLELSVLTEIQEARENFKLSSASRLKTIPQITNIINKTDFRKPSKIILEKKCTLEEKKFEDLSKTLASSKVNLLSSQAIPDYKNSIQSAMGFYRTMKPFGGFKKTSSESLLQSFGDHRGFDALTGFKYQQKCYISNDNKSISEITLLEKYIKTEYLPLTVNSNLISAKLVGDIIEVTNNSNSYIELAGYSIYKGDSILSSDFNKYKSMPPKSVMTLSASNEFNKFKIIVDKSFYSLKLPKSHKLGFAVSYYKEGIKKALFKDKRLAIIYK
tara:strand:+ start:135 stop:1496 length:1362 start_codon:yes stop_codon:yes gene_type:complete